MVAGALMEVLMETQMDKSGAVNGDVGKNGAHKRW